MKKFFLAFVILLAILFGLYGIFVLFVVSGMFLIFQPEPLQPEITYGEFPFRLTYELNGEIIVIEDTIICEYDGTSDLTNTRRKWKSHLKSDNERVTLLDFRPLGEMTENGANVLELYFDYGYAKYYMGEINSIYAREAKVERVNYVLVNSLGNVVYYFFDAETAYERYGIKILSWEVSPPIENRFEPKRLGYVSDSLGERTPLLLISYINHIPISGQSYRIKTVVRVDLLEL